MGAFLRFSGGAGDGNDGDRLATGSRGGGEGRSCSWPAPGERREPRRRRAEEQHWGKKEEKIEALCSREGENLDLDRPSLSLSVSLLAHQKERAPLFQSSTRVHLPLSKSTSERSFIPYYSPFRFLRFSHQKNDARSPPKLTHKKTKKRKKRTSAPRPSPVPDLRAQLRLALGGPGLLLGPQAALAGRPGVWRPGPGRGC